MYGTLHFRHENSAELKKAADFHCLSLFLNATELPNLTAVVEQRNTRAGMELQIPNHRLLNNCHPTVSEHHIYQQ